MDDWQPIRARRVHKEHLALDEKGRVLGHVRLSGHVDPEWEAAFASARQHGDAPTGVSYVDDQLALTFGPVRHEELPAVMESIRHQIETANASVGPARERATMEAKEAEERLDEAIDRAVQTIDDVLQAP